MVSKRIEALLSIVRSGLQPRVAHPKKVVVVGAGMAGLVTAYELQRAGHDLTILEARERVGGRVLTVREPFSNGLYGEAGAMRIPGSHKLTLTYIERLGLQTTRFTKANDNAFYYFNGRKHLRHDVESDPACLGFDFAGPTGTLTVLQLWAEFIRDTAKRLEADEGYWEELLSQYGDCSLFDYLKGQAWSTGAIHGFALVEGLEQEFGKAFLDALQFELQHVAADMVQIVGGMDGLPRAFLPALQDCIRFGSEMVALDYTSESVTIYYQSQEGLQHVTGDFAIVTVPYPALPFVDVLKPFSPGKQLAIRQLNYENAVKVLLQCRRRFWEEDDKLFGGATRTDLPIRVINYPDHGRETGQGVLTGCYAYQEEAKRWMSVPQENRVTQTLKYVAKIHPQITREFETGYCKMWGEDRFAGGVGVVFEPSQQTRLYPHIVAPEGPIHFAGEHTSLKHIWIEGAVESGLRAAQEVHERSLAVNSE